MDPVLDDEALVVKTAADVSPGLLNHGGGEIVDKLNADKVSSSNPSFGGEELNKNTENFSVTPLSVGLTVDRQDE